MYRSSVIIPTYNRLEILKKTLEKYLYQLETGENDFELVVINDGSTDGTDSFFSRLAVLPLEEISITSEHRKRVKRVNRGKLNILFPDKNFFSNPPVTYISMLKSGRSVARNTGIEVCNGSLIVFTDDDIFVESRYISKHISYHHTDDMLVVMGRVINTDRLDNPYNTRWKLRDINTAFLSTGNASVYKHYIEKAGYFDENYTIYGWEDFDLGIHLSEIGLKSIKKPVYGYHYNPESREFIPVELYNKERERGITAVYFYNNHPLKWVRRFTMVNNKFLMLVVDFLFKVFFSGHKMNDPVKMGSFKKLILRYKGYFEGVRIGKEQYR